MEGVAFSSEVIKVLDNIAEKIGIAIDWTDENVVPYVTEILSKYRNYGIITNSIGVFISFVIIILMVFMVIHRVVKPYHAAYNTEKDNFWWLYDPHYNRVEAKGTLIVFISFIIFMSVLFICFACISIDDLVKWIVIPEIKYIDLLKGLM